MGLKFWRAFAAFVKWLVKLAIVVGWSYLVVNLPALNVWLALTVWALFVADFWLWLCHSRYCETPRWFDWFPPGVGFYCWRQMRPRKRRKRQV
jgi:hypothetical protein